MGNKPILSSKPTQNRWQCFWRNRVTPVGFCKGLRSAIFVDHLNLAVQSTGVPKPALYFQTRRTCHHKYCPNSKGCNDEATIFWQRNPPTDFGLIVLSHDSKRS